MVCKNCDSSLRSDFSYCPNCGAKVIRNRLTIKNIWQDLSFQVFNLDNTLLKTFRHLFTSPEKVVESFVSGTRKKYMNPISYFAIAITLSGLLFFVLRRIYEVNLTGNSLTNANTPNLDFIFDYQGLLSYLIMPIYALLTWLLFLDKNKLNYTEHLVANSYTTAQASFVQVMICLPLFGLFKIPYDIFNWLFLVLIVIYQFIVFGRIHGTSIMNTFLRGLAYLFLMVFVMLGIGVLIISLMLLVGKVNIQDFAPKP
ncbi:DUF3667 domain-containing protein [Flagellimonas allohymeniacidonis]|uniref:DUF3667 domain-containing protein n=1 Tax=Flagellimonas allohymeniacidonis TaxID=2517819 RepID=A0A4Q8QMH0_9FLAO|nr:DUF3667 domain-containing protein [Allomuricauda hymeniacidonis]TAI49506.1 DUF3667 domain-containing protein [Allomuricauda hymeniacidonis]